MRMLIDQGSRSPTRGGGRGRYDSRQEVGFVKADVAGCRALAIAARGVLDARLVEVPG